MIQPAKPNARAATHSLQANFPHRGQALIAAIKKENSTSKLLPDWREFQIIKLINTVNLFAADLLERYRARRIDALANTTRNLAEICIWTQYCNLSEAHARRFFEDCARDFREMLEAIQKVYISENGEPQERLATIIDQFHDVAVAFGIKDYDERYIQVRDAAQDVGRLGAFNGLYKTFSKLAHPTSLILALDVDTGALTEMLDAVYVGGESFARASMREIEKTIHTALPSVIF